MEWYFIAYLTILGIIWVALAISTFISGDDMTLTDKRNAARVAVLAPVWPLIVPFFLFKGGRAVWRTADWRNAQHDYDEDY